MGSNSLINLKVLEALWKQVLKTHKDVIVHAVV